MNSSLVCGVERSVLGQAWRWRGAADNQCDQDFQPDELVDRLLLARGVLARGSGSPPCPDLARLHAGSLDLPRHGQSRRSAGRRSPERRENHRVRRLRRRWRHFGRLADPAASRSRREPAILHSRSADGGIRAFGRSTCADRGRWRPVDRHRRLRCPGLRGARMRARGRGRGDRRRSPPMRKRASGRACFGQSQPARRG